MHGRHSLMPGPPVIIQALAGDVIQEPGQSGADQPDSLPHFTGERNLIGNVKADYSHIRDPCLQNFMGRLRVGPEIVFRHRTNIPCIFRTAHDDEALEIGSKFGAAADGIGDIGAGPCSKERYLTGMAVDIFHQKSDSIFWLLMAVGGNGLGIPTQSVIPERLDGCGLPIVQSP